MEGDLTYPGLSLSEALQANGYDNLHGYSLSEFEDCEPKKAQFYLNPDGVIILWLMPKDSCCADRGNRFFRNQNKDAPIRVWG